MRTARYRAVPPKIDCRQPIEGEIDRRRPIEGEIDRRRSIEREKGKKKKKRKRRKKEKRTRTSPVRRRPRVAGTFSPAWGERLRRPVCTVHTTWYQYHTSTERNSVHRYGS
ncbi:hypothetical protein GW17_00055157, partial [Ensete ventricosum]